MIPVCHACDGRSIYSVLDQKPKRVSVTQLRRVRNIQANPHVALVVDHYDADWRRLWYLLLTGTAELLEAGDEQARAIRLLRQNGHVDRHDVADIEPLERPRYVDQPLKLVSAQGDTRGKAGAVAGERRLRC